MPSSCDDADGTGLELLALDRGRGMTDAGRCMQDGYSTAGSPGNGLGAIARLADSVRIYSRPGQGCAIMVRFIERRSARHAARCWVPRLRLIRARRSAATTGRWQNTANGRTIMLVDGSGHGIEAARAAETAMRTFSQNADAACEDIVERMHRALAPTRGAALAVARIDTAARVVRFVGVGNISGVLVNAGKARHMVSHNGTAGHVAPRIREFTYDFTGDPLVILHSDGLTSRWDLASYPGLAVQHPVADRRRAAARSPARPRRCLGGRDAAGDVGKRMNTRLLQIAIAAETDIVLVRSRTRRLAELIGFDAQDQTRITTAVSEIARNAYEYARRRADRIPPDRRAGGQSFVIMVRDRGPGIADLPAVLAGSHKSATGMGVGLLGARRLMDTFDITSKPGEGTTVTDWQDAAAAGAGHDAGSARRAS